MVVFQIKNFAKIKLLYLLQEYSFYICYKNKVFNYYKNSSTIK